MSKSYLDFFKPEDIQLKKMWEVIARMLFPKGASEIQYLEMRRAFYIGFTECFKIMSDVSDRMSEEEASKVLARLHNEVNSFFENEIPKIKQGFDPAKPGADKTVEAVVDPVKITRENYHGHEPEHIRELLKEMGNNIAKGMPTGWGFTLFLFSYGANGNLLYLSSASREDMVKTLREFLEKQPQ